MAGYNKADPKTYEERVYEISRMLRRKPTSYVLEYIVNTYGVEITQAYNYIKDAKEEWKKYFEKLKGDGMAYYVTQIRELKDMAMDQKRIVGKDGNTKAINVPNLPLVLDIIKEEAKLMGIYPSEKHDVKVGGEVKITDARQKLADRINNILARTGEEETT